MVIFKSESDLLQIIDKHDDLVRQLVKGSINFSAFCDNYQDFFAWYALDGHESDDEECLLLQKHAARIEPHRVIAYDILGKVCADDDAKLDSYRDAGRFGSAEAVARIRNVRFVAEQP